MENIFLRLDARWISGVLAWCLGVMVAAGAPPATAPVDHVTLDAIAQSLRQDRSLLGAYRFEMTQLSQRDPEGGKVLVEQNPQLKIEVKDADKPARRDYTRMRDGEKELLICNAFDEKMKPKGQIVRTWDGAAGKMFNSQALTGRIERVRPPESDQFPDSIAFDFAGKPIAEWVSSSGNHAQVVREPDAVAVSLPVSGGEQGFIVTFHFDPAHGFLPKREELTCAGQPRMTWEITEFRQLKVGGTPAFFPGKFKVVQYIVRDVKQGQSIKTVPLMKVETVVNKLDVNLHPTPDEFDVKFPPNAQVYDAFSGESIIRENTAQVKQQIDSQVDAARANASLRSK